MVEWILRSIELILSLYAPRSALDFTTRWRGGRSNIAPAIPKQANRCTLVSLWPPYKGCVHDDENNNHGIYPVNHHRGKSSVLDKRSTACSNGSCSVVSYFFRWGLKVTLQRDQVFPPNFPVRRQHRRRKHPSLLIFLGGCTLTVSSLIAAYIFLCLLVIHPQLARDIPLFSNTPLVKNTVVLPNAPSSMPRNTSNVSNFLTFLLYISRNFPDW